jgi:peptidylprolyl isomerase
VKVHYTGTLMNGKEFDSSRGPGKQPFKVGGKRKLTIPWQLAYGEAGSGDKIPPKAALKFDIELLEIEGAGGGDAGAKPAGSAKK